MHNASKLEADGVQQQNTPVSIPDMAKKGHWWWWCNGVRHIFLAHFVPLTTNWSLFKFHSLHEYCWWDADHVHPLMTKDGWIMHPITKLKSSQTGFFCKESFILYVK